MPEIVLLRASDFKRHYPSSYFWKDRNNWFHFDPTKLSVFVDDDDNDLFYDPYPSSFSISNKAHVLEKWKKRLSEHPVVFLVTLLERSRLDCNYVNLEKYVVFVKSPHLLLHSPIVEAFNRCSALQQVHKKFTLKISVENIVRNWYNSEPNNDLCFLSSIRGACVSMGTYNLKQCEDIARDPLLAGCCFPCYVAFGVPYMLYRSTKYKKIKVNFNFVSIHDASHDLHLSCSHLESLFQSHCTFGRRGNVTNLEIGLAVNDRPPSYEDCVGFNPPSYEQATAEQACDKVQVT